ncbi:hypothetical protein ACEPAI_6236 [Sanghuangporus weigelae]
MVDWNSEAEILKDERAFESLIYALFGLYVWEMCQTSSVEWSLITRRRKFRWPMVRFSSFNKPLSSSFTDYILDILFPMSVLHAVGTYWPYHIIQQSEQVLTIFTKALYTFNSWTGNMAILSASTSLMIRTIAIWERKLTVVIPLLILCLGHWGLLYHGIIIVRATWDPDTGSCAVNQTNSAILKFTFFATMGFDLIIFVITSTALLRNSTRSGLWHLLFRDGLIYWAVTFSVNSIPAVLNSLDLNTPMNIIATVPAATVSAIAACRCVVRLQEYGTSDVYVNNASGIGSMDGRVRFSSTANMGITSFGKNSRIVQRPEVHIRTDQITMENLGTIEYEDTNVGSAITTDTLKTPRDLEEGPVRGFVHYDDKFSHRV